MCILAVMKPSKSEARVSDDDRADVLQQLGAGLTTGRLDLAEFQQRLDLALVARQSGELAELTADLPADQRAIRRRETLEWLAEWRWWLAGALVGTGVWSTQSLLAGEAVRFWPALPLAIWMLVIVAAAVVPSGGLDKS